MSILATMPPKASSASWRLFGAALLISPRSRTQLGLETVPNLLVQLGREVLPDAHVGCHLVLPNNSVRPWTIRFRSSLKSRNFFRQCLVAHAPPGDPLEHAREPYGRKQAIDVVLVRIASSVRRPDESVDVGNMECEEMASRLVKQVTNEPLEMPREQGDRSAVERLDLGRPSDTGVGDSALMTSPTFERSPPTALMAASAFFKRTSAPCASQQLLDLAEPLLEVRQGL